MPTCPSKNCGTVNVYGAKTPLELQKIDEVKTKFRGIYRVIEICWCPKERVFYRIMGEQVTREEAKQWRIEKEEKQRLLKEAAQETLVPKTA